MTNTLLPVLSANPLNMVRSLPTSLISLKDIELPAGLPDDNIFLAKYTAFLTGKVPVHHTRISLSAIRRGLWKKSDAGYELLGDCPVIEDVEYIKTIIRLGNRPALHLYENPNKSDAMPYVCTDDIQTHAAYEALGIAVVPVVLMAKPNNIEESCISIRCLHKKSKEGIALIDGVVTVKHEKVRSLLAQKKYSLHDSLMYLIEAIERTRASLRAFHQSADIKHHYHHSLHSVLLRAKENIEAILQLVESGKILIATSLLRPLYELTLTFYIDWLLPEHMYRYLQLASVKSEKEWQMECNDEMQASIADGVSYLDAKNIRDAHMRSYRLCSVVGEKARLFPVGEIHQRNIYSFLSDILHHDFSMDARYIHTLDHGDDAVYVQDASDSISYIADILIAVIISRVQSDIGFISNSVSEDETQKDQQKVPRS